MPKSMLPVANQPLIYYPLSWLHAAGVSSENTIVVAHSPKAASRLAHYLANVYEHGKTELVVLPEARGTVDALMAVRDRITGGHVVVVGCDLVTDYVLSEAIEQHRAQDSDVTVLLTPSEHAQDEEGVYAGLDDTRTRLLHLVDKADVDKAVGLRMALVERHPCILLHTDLIDVHCYIVKRQVLQDDALFARNMYSLREEMVPRIVRHGSVGVKVVGSGLCLRANTFKGYAEANRQMLRVRSSTAGRISLAAEISDKAQVGSDCVVGDRAIVGERSSVKKSAIGSNVRIGANVKISNAVLMDYVVVEDGCRLDGVVVGPFALIEEKTVLKDCEVGARFVVSKETNCKGEMFAS